MNCWTNVADKFDMIRFFLFSAITAIIRKPVDRWDRWDRQDRWTNFSAILATPAIPTIIWKPGLRCLLYGFVDYSGFEKAIES